MVVPRFFEMVTSEQMTADVSVKLQAATSKTLWLWVDPEFKKRHEPTWSVLNHCVARHASKWKYAGDEATLAAMAKGKDATLAVRHLVDIHRYVRNNKVVERRRSSKGQFS